MTYEILRTNNGKVLTHTSLGCYPVFYLDRDNSIVCAECVQKEEDDLEEGDERMFPITGHGINWESRLYCDECSREIESAYDPIEGY